MISLPDMCPVFMSDRREYTTGFPGEYHHDPNIYAWQAYIMEQNCPNRSSVSTDLLGGGFLCADLSPEECGYVISRQFTRPPIQMAGLADCE